MAKLPKRGTRQALANANSSPLAAFDEVLPRRDDSTALSRHDRLLYPKPLANGTVFRVFSTNAWTSDFDAFSIERFHVRARADMAGTG
jgi:hypothetical protein